MRQISIISLLFFLIYLPEARGQGLTGKYKDSVNEFLSDWQGGGSHFQYPLILDTSTLLFSHVDSMTIWENRTFRFNLNGMRVYRFKYPIQDYFSNRIDSISLSKKEMKYIVNKMQYPIIQKWNNDFFPKARFTTKREVDSFFKLYYFVWGKAGEVMKKCDFDTTKMNNYSIYRQYRQMRGSDLWREGYWKISNPVFLKQGTFAVMFYWNFYGDTFVPYFFDVYKKENSHWNYYGYIDGGNIN